MIREIQKLIHTDYNGSIRSDTLLYSAGYENENNAHVIVLKGYCVTRSRYTAQNGLAPSLPDVGQFNQIKLPVIPFQIQINNFGSPLAYQNLDALARPWRIRPTYFCVTQSQSHALKMRTQMCSFSVTFLLQKNKNNFQQHQGWMKMQFLDSIKK